MEDLCVVVLPGHLVLNILKFTLNGDLHMCVYFTLTIP